MPEKKEKKTLAESLTELNILKARAEGLGEIFYPGSLAKVLIEMIEDNKALHEEIRSLEMRLNLLNSNHEHHTHDGILGGTIN